MRLLVLISTVVINSRAPLAAQNATPVETTIRGIVFDSLAVHGLSNATVQIADASGKPFTRSATTDSLGAFEITGVPVGTYLVGFFHAKVDSLGLTSPTLRLDVRTAQPIQLRLATPSARTVARAVCGRGSVTDSTGLLMGYVRGADNSMPRTNGTVLVKWSELIIEKGSISRTVPTVEASTGPTGIVAVCGVPLSTPILLQAASASDSSGSFEVTIPTSGFLHRDIFVAPFNRKSIQASDSTPAVELLRGPSTLRGRIVAMTGRPIQGARVMLWGTGIETTTDADGAFQLGGLPGGTHTLEVRAVGYAPVQQPVDIVQGAPDATQVELANLAIALDTVRVSARRLYTSRREADFERRLHSGIGHIVEQQEIQKRKPIFLTDLLRTIPGIRIVPSRYTSEDVLMQGGEGILGPGVCRPDLYVDGSRVANDPTFPINSLVITTELRALEVYARPSTVPMQFRSLSGCGVILIWTVR